MTVMNKMARKDALFARTSGAFEEAKASFIVLFETNELVNQWNNTVEAEKARLITTGVIDGKNETERKGQLNIKLAPQMEQLAHAENKLRKAKYFHDLARLEIESIKTLLRVLELEEEFDIFEDAK